LRLNDGQPIEGINRGDIELAELQSEAQSFQQEGACLLVALFEKRYSTLPYQYPGGLAEVTGLPRHTHSLIEGLTGCPGITQVAAQQANLGERP
jgi:hypothetical protein